MLNRFSNPAEAKRKAKKYLGPHGGPLFLSSRDDKKYMVVAPSGKKVHFGQMGYEDYTKHKDKERRASYLRRATKIKGDWKDNKFSPNNLSINILW
jgi:hypothetical protein